MAFTRRRSGSPYRSLGFEAAVGLEPRRERERTVADPPEGRSCPHCAASGTVYMIDTARVRAYLWCQSCTHEWDTDRFEALA